MASVVLLQRATSRRRTFSLKAIHDLVAVTEAAVVDLDGGTLAEARGVIIDQPLRTSGTFAALRRRPDMVFATFTAGKGWPSAGHLRYLGVRPHRPHRPAVRCHVRPDHKGGSSEASCLE